MNAKSNNYICDRCKKEFRCDVGTSGGFVNVKLPVLYHFLPDETFLGEFDDIEDFESKYPDSSSLTRRVMFHTYDLCDDCMQTLTQIQCVMVPERYYSKKLSFRGQYKAVEKSVFDIDPKAESIKAFHEMEHRDCSTCKNRCSRGVYEKICTMTGRDTESSFKWLQDEYPFIDAKNCCAKWTYDDRTGKDFDEILESEPENEQFRGGDIHAGKYNYRLY